MSKVNQSGAEKRGYMAKQESKKMGRPSSGRGRKNLVIEATEDEYQVIIRWIRDTRKRTLILLKAAREEEEQATKIEQAT